jgi:glucan phosphoethanolaminetransferase (alkaline phosphatase superfamily)
MTKKQKIWLGVFLAMFLIPEIFWSPYSSFYYAILSSSSGDSFQLFNLAPQPKSLVIQKLIVFVQCFGLLLSLFVLSKSQIKNKSIKLFAKLILSILLILAIYFLFFIFNFSPQIG